MAHLTGPPEAAAIHLNAVRPSPMLDHQRNPAPLPHAAVTPGGSHPSVPHQPSPKAPWGVPSSMAALINAASLDTNPNASSIKDARKTPQGENMKSGTPPPTQPSEKEITSEIKEENSYYPFGLKHKGYNNVIN